MDRGIITISEAGMVTIPTAPVWMTQFEIADLFGVFSCDIRKAIHAIYRNKELNECDTIKYIKQPDGISYDVYNLEIYATKKENSITLFVSCGRGSNLWYS